jgi:hypothetical protein
MKLLGTDMLYGKSYTRNTKKTINDKSVQVKSQCPSGFIKRAAYMRYTKSGKHIRVAEGCIRDIGEPGKGFKGPGEGIGKLRKGELVKHGYTHVVDLTVSDRHTALHRAVKEYGSLGVWRKLNAVSIYSRRTNPPASAIFKADSDWIRDTYGLKAL